MPGYLSDYHIIMSGILKLGGGVGDGKSLKVHYCECFSMNGHLATVQIFL